MGQITQAGNPLTDVTLRRSKQARRMTLRVSRLDGRVTLTVPRGVSEREAAGFVRAKADWIARAKSDVADEVVVKQGAEVPVEGQFRRIVAGISRRAVIGDTIEAPATRTGTAVATALKERARTVRGRVQGPGRTASQRGCNGESFESRLARRERGFRQSNEG